MRRIVLLQLLPLGICLVVLALLFPWKPIEADCGETAPSSDFPALSTAVHVVCFVLLLVTLFKIANDRHRLADKPGRAGWPFVLSVAFLGWIGIAIVTSGGSDSLGGFMLFTGAAAAVLVALQLGLPAAILLAVLVVRALRFGEELDEGALLKWETLYLVLLSLAIFSFLPTSAIAFAKSGPLWCF